MKKIILLLCFFTTFSISMELPEYYITIDQCHIESLNSNPYSDNYYQASFSYLDKSYDCQVRYRGGSSRNYPKKSWKIDLFNDDNIFECEKLNLDADYNDVTMLRNHQTMKLYKSMGFPAPKTEHIKLYVNNEYMGVFLSVENIDKYFLANYNLEKNCIFKAKNHGAHMAPLCQLEDYQYSWEIQIGENQDYNRLYGFLNKLYYLTNDDFAEQINEIVDLDNIINYFAIEFVISSQDCITKNLYLYLNPETKKWMLFPWDNDATFGFNWKGQYDPNFEKYYNDVPINNQILFQRLMEHDLYNAKFWTAVQTIINEKFPILLSEIDVEAHNIQSDYFNDTHKKCNNSEFYKTISDLLFFIRKRKDFLNSKGPIQRPLLTDLYCSNSFPGVDSTVTFRVTSSSKRNISLVYIYDLEWDVLASLYKKKSITLYDDGLHNDVDAGDLIYGNEVQFTNLKPQLLPFYFKISNYYYPANGDFYINYVKAHTYAIQLNDKETTIANQIRIDKIYQLYNDHIIKLVNTSDSDSDLSYCTLQAGNYWERFLIPAGTIIPPQGSINITSDLELGNFLFNDDINLGNCCLNPVQGDSIRLISPINTTLVTKYCPQFDPIESPVANIIINEINYNSCDSFDVGDWVELYNPNAFEVDLSYWSLTDGNNDNNFIFPLNTTILPNDFLVICTDIDDFSVGFPDVYNKTGEMDFKLSSSGESLLLYNTTGTLIDSLTYDDKYPWPDCADGKGPTLELINPKRDNSVAENWVASTGNGSPGALNSQSLNINDPQHIATKWYLQQNYPNPFNNQTHIGFNAGKNQQVEIKIYNIKGQLVETLHPQLNRFVVSWNAEMFSSGFYIYQLVKDGMVIDTKKALLLK